MSRAAPIRAELFDPAFLAHRVRCFAQEMGHKCPRCAELRDAARSAAGGPVVPVQPETKET